MAGRKQPSASALKLLLIGDSAVGKSCLLNRFADDSFSFSFLTTIGVDYRLRTIDINGEPVKLSIWDTAGQERFRTITSAYYRGAQGVVLVYDITSRPSFDSIRSWIRDIDEHTHTSESVCKLLVGNKADMEDRRAVSKEEGRALANEFGIGFYETSAKADVNVEEAFVSMAKEAKRRHELAHPRSSSSPSSGDDESSRRRRLNINDPSLAPVAPSSCCA